MSAAKHRAYAPTAIPTSGPRVHAAQATAAFRVRGLAREVLWEVARASEAREEVGTPRGYRNRRGSCSGRPPAKAPPLADESCGWSSRLRSGCDKRQRHPPVRPCVVALSFRYGGRDSAAPRQGRPRSSSRLQQSSTSRRVRPNRDESCGQLDNRRTVPSHRLISVEEARSIHGTRQGSLEVLTATRRSELELRICESCRTACADGDGPL